MNINKDDYKIIREEKLLIDHVFCLYLINQKEQLPVGLKAYCLLLYRRDFLTKEYNITQKGEELLGKLNSSPALAEIKKEKEKEENKGSVDYSDYCELIHKELKKKLKILIGAENKYLDSNKWLIPSQKVIEKRLADAHRIYGFELDEKVLKVLLRHIENCARNKFVKVRTIEYFILGQNAKGSDLDTALDNFSEKENDETKTAVGAVDI